MRVLLTVPHFYNAQGNAHYGSTGPNIQRRVAALSRCIAGVHQTFGPKQAFLLYLTPDGQKQSPGKLATVNNFKSTRLDIVICTSGQSHLLPNLAPISHLFTHQPVSTHPMKLGFACHEVLKQRFGNYDLYGYLEDDLLIHDAQFLQKLKWFNSQFGDETVLFPHRYETDGRQPLHKIYIDGPVRPDFTSKWQDVADRRIIQSQTLGEPVSFVRWPNPHSGCFFLTARQMERWICSPNFLDEDCGFAGPLESAASLGIMRNFRIYKPAIENAGFFELEHLHKRYLGGMLKLS